MVSSISTELNSTVTRMRGSTVVLREQRGGVERM